MRHTNIMNQIKDTYVVGLTGGIGSGKSTVSKLLIAKGYHVIDADQVSREVVMPETEGLKKIVATFGSDMLDLDGNLDRRKLGDLVFNNPEALKKLNQILHPLIHLRITQKVEALSNEQIVFVDVPLLFETNQSENYNEVLLIYVDDETALSRIVTRDQIDADLALKKIRSQISINTKKTMADFVIENDSGIDALNVALAEYLQNLIIRCINWQKNNER
ncbi:dephospho-CoA kinase [Fusibacter bizertensis]|uniref:Dephospho-CoA kinase n=1 Tax=Fusibacter bizertensis TaxID=1488331 RepID=A0ABT6ND55_9FIRM|nr:dephospho-CoA kinase [Fusibacter bizertensis]MDH8678343.1 dephospho-CoA kinase [Fusibacter bizertensis]